jgi:hypothetical protein
MGFHRRQIQCTMRRSARPRRSGSAEMRSNISLASCRGETIALPIRIPALSLGARQVSMQLP